MDNQKKRRNDISDCNKKAWTTSADIYFNFHDDLHSHKNRPTIERHTSSLA